MQIIKNIFIGFAYLCFFAFTCFVNFYLCGIIAAIFLDNVNGGLFAAYMIITPAVISIVETIALYRKFQKKQRKVNTPSSQSVVTLSEKSDIPFSKKKQTEMAADILADIDLNVSLANKAERVSFFIEWYDEALKGFSRLMQLNKVTFDGSPALDYYRLKDQFQWHLCDAIVRAKEKTITDITGKYRNSREFQRRSAEAFEDDINSIRNRCSTDTLALADASLAEVQNLAELNKSGILKNYDSIGAQPTRHHDIDLELSQIDQMEGHAFEYWCADLLSEIGYCDVSVTQASGDYGVDVLATKDGIRYAIQCKCYGKDLGSEPVREVNSGKSMPVYNCHVGAVMTNRYFTKSAIAEAEANHILLWDRDWISDKLRQLNGATVSSSSITGTPVVSKHPVIGNPTTISDSPPIPEKLSEYIHKAQWYAASRDDEE